MLQQILFFLFVHVTLLLPGYVFVVNLRFLKKHPALELAFGYVAGIAFFALIATVSYVLKLHEIIPQVIFWITCLSGAVLFVYQKLYTRLFKEWIPLAALVLTTIFSLAFVNLSYSGNQTFIPDPTAQGNRNYNVLNVKVLNLAGTPANDNYIPYRQAQFFVNHSDPAKDSFIDDWGVHFFQRTPLMGAVSAQYFMAFTDYLPIGYSWAAESVDPDNTYVKFQIIAQILNALFIIPAFYLLTRLFNKRTAALALCFIVPSQFFMFNAFFSWPKSLVAFFILLSWLLLLQKGKRFVVLAAGVSGLAYLAHDLAVLYIGASFLLLLYQKRFRDTIIFTLTCTLFALPWLFTSGVLYKRPSSFILYPLSIHDIPTTDRKHEIIKEFFDTSPLRLIAIRLESLFYLLSPYQLIYSEGGQAIGRRIWGLGLFSIPGAMGIGLFIPMLIGAFQRLRDLSFWILALVPIILSVVVIGWPKGLGAMHFAEGSVALFIGLGCSWLIRRARSIWTMLAYGAGVVQLVVLGYYAYYGHTANWLTSPSNLLCLIAITAVVIVCGLVAYRIQTERIRLPET